MTSLEEFAAVRTPLKAPSGWEPSVEKILGPSGQVVGGSATVALSAPDAKHESLLIEAGFDPTVTRIVGNVAYRKWMRYDQEWLHYYKFDTSPRDQDSVEERHADIEELKALFKRRPSPPSLPDREPRWGDDGVAVVWSDWQIGKGENGGTEATIERIRQSFLDTAQYVKDLRKVGFKVPKLLVAGTGDLFEGCQGFYAMQEYQTDLNDREQRKVVRRLGREGLEILAPQFDEVEAIFIGGNHGENRRDGKAFTDFSDNKDVAVLEDLQEVLAEREGYAHVHFRIPHDELAVCTTFAGVNIGLVHGHQFRGGTTAQKKAEAWWSAQAFGFQPLAQAQIMISGHYHHFSSNTYGVRTHLQAPSMDGGSLWFKNSTGIDSPTGTLVMRVTKDHPFGWDNLRIL